jgi:D-amino-acid dehydrogenase
VKELAEKLLGPFLKIQSFSNLYLASGHAMQGVTLAPNTARVMSDLMLSGKTSTSIDAFKPERF